MSQIETLTKRLERAQSKVQILEKMIEDSTRHLYVENQRVKRAKEELDALLNAMLNALIVIDDNGFIVLANRAFIKLSGYLESEIPGINYSEIIKSEPDNKLNEKILIGKNDREIFVLVNQSEISLSEISPFAKVLVFQDLTDFKKLQIELQSSQKLQSVGRLAAGIAHEINTPIQYIGDNIAFLSQTIKTFSEIIRNVKAYSASNNDSNELLEKINQQIISADIDFALEESPIAIEHSLEGISRVSSIVTAMKEFSHPGTESKQNTDINKLINNTIAISSSEWKYVSKVAISFDSEIATIPCYPGELGQVILNMIVNACHSIEEKYRPNETGELGKIEIKTKKTNDNFFCIEIKDNGNGMSKEIQEKIFEPFFTTKEVGRGTGQGLAFAWHIIVEKHKGQLKLESSPTNGATFSILLPED